MRGRTGRKAAAGRAAKWEAMEMLESRVLLSAGAWAGSWTMSGFDTSADNWVKVGGAWTQGVRVDFQPQAVKFTVTITDLAGDECLMRVSGGPGAFEMTLTNKGDMLEGHMAEDDTDDSYHDCYVRGIMLAPTVAVFSFSDGGYESSTKTDFLWSSGVAGLMTRGTVAATPRPWDGQYVLDEYEVEADNANPGNVTENHTGSSMSITKQADGTYLVFETEHPDESCVFSPSSNRLVYQTTKTTTGGNIGKRWDTLVRAPNDTLLLVEGCVDYTSGTNQDMLYASHAVGILRPKVGSKYLPDLTASLTGSVLPAALISGNGQKINVSVVVKNEGVGPAPAGAKMNVEIFARTDDGLGGTTDTLIGSLTKQSVSGLGAGKSKTLKGKVTLPIGLASGSYSLVAKIDSGGVITESNGTDTAETNNETVSPTTITVTEGRPDLSAAMGTVKMPMVVLNDTAIKGTAQVIITNVGNVAVPAGVKATIEIVLVDGHGNQTVVGRLANCAVNMAAKGKKTVTVAVNRAAGLPAETYQLQARVSLATALNEWATTNNTASWASTIYSGAAIADLTGSNLKYKARTYAAGTPIKVQFLLKNQGTAATGPFDVDVYLSADDKLDLGSDYLLGQSEEDTVIRAGQSHTAYVTRPSLPSGMTPGSYYVIVVIDANSAVTEGHEDNNLLVSAVANVIIV
jgi:hypothetical protein